MVTTTDGFAGQAFGGAPLIRSHLGRCQPAEALSDEPELGRWRAVPYAAEGFQGVALMASAETAAPDVTLPLDASGPHAIWIGLQRTSPAEGARSRLRLRLSDDAAFAVLAWDAGGHPERTRLEEHFWKVAELTGQHLVIGQVTRRLAPGDGLGRHDCDPVRLFYVRLVPLSPAEAAAHTAGLARTDTKRLHGHNDAHGVFHMYPRTRPDELMTEIEPYRDTDFSRIYWEAAAGEMTLYPSQVGQWPVADHVHDFPRRGDRFYAESVRALRDGGIDPLQVVLEHTHAIGLEFHAAYRLLSGTYPAPLDTRRSDTLYERRPDLRCEARDGSVVPRLSLASPEVRELFLGILEELATYPVDGVALLFNRRPPVVAYESAMREAFQKRHGLDPRDLDPADPRWLEAKAGVVTEFMRAVRRTVDSAAARRGGSRPDVTAIVMGRPDENRLYGFDIAAWIQEGLIDSLVPYSPAPLGVPGEDDIWHDVRDIQHYATLTRGTSCLLSVNVMPRVMPPEDLRRMAERLYDAGADALFFWDCAAGGGRAAFDRQWDALRRLGHRDEIQAWQTAGEPRLPTPGVALRSVDGWDMRFTPPG